MRNEEFERRESPRKKTFAPVSIILERDLGPCILKGFILDLSESGCLIQGDLSQVLESDVVLDFPIPFFNHRIKAKARVMRCVAAGNGVQSGVKFLGIEPVDKKQLASFISLLENFEGLRGTAQPIGVSRGIVTSDIPHHYTYPSVYGDLHNARRSLSRSARPRVLRAGY